MGLLFACACEVTSIVALPIKLPLPPNQKQQKPSTQPKNRRQLLSPSIYIYIHMCVCRYLVAPPLRPSPTHHNCRRPLSHPA